MTAPDAPTAGERGALRCCPSCSEPVVFTFEFRGHERYCVACGWKGDTFAGRDLPATAERVQRHADLTARYEVERAERTGHAAPPPPRQDVPRPVCGGCGTEAQGVLSHEGKPAHWFCRTRDGVTSYACSRGCIPSNEMVMPW